MLIQVNCHFVVSVGDVVIVSEQTSFASNRLPFAAIHTVTSSLYSSSGLIPLLTCPPNGPLFAWDRFTAVVLHNMTLRDDAKDRSFLPQPEHQTIINRARMKGKCE
jgi:hypothetical protein